MRPIFTERTGSRLTTQVTPTSLAFWSKAVQDQNLLTHKPDLAGLTAP